jgi:anti-sigma regulatory factor (Ser/Thr protein kinase)
MTSFDHAGLLYRDTGEYVAGTTRFARAALAAGQPVLLVVPGPRLATLLAELSDVAGRVTSADMAVVGRNPGRLIPGVLLPFAAAHPGRRVSIIGEPIWPGRTDREHPACAAHEALLNVVFAGHDAAVLCPYDASGLHPAAILDAWRTHPVMIEDGAGRASPHYTDPLVTAARFNQPLPPVPAHATSLPYRHAAALTAVRRFVRERAAAVLTAGRTAHLVLAVSELATNTIEHTSGPGRITVWTEPTALICQNDDHGHLADPLAGRLPPRGDQAGGRGLLLVHEICDLVRIHTTPTGTTVRLHMSR